MAGPEIFRSKVDWWFYLVLAVVALALAGSFVSLSQTNEPFPWAAAVAAPLLALGLPAWMLLCTYYKVDAQQLHIRCGPFRWTVPLTEIRSIEPSRSVLSSPALSLDRLLITYGTGKQVMVSPERRHEFLALLER